MELPRKAFAPPANRARGKAPDTRRNSLRLISMVEETVQARADHRDRAELADLIPTRRNHVPRMSAPSSNSKASARYRARMSRVVANPAGVVVRRQLLEFGQDPLRVLERPVGEHDQVLPVEGDRVGVDRTDDERSVDARLLLVPGVAVVPVRGDGPGAPGARPEASAGSDRPGARRRSAASRREPVHSGGRGGVEQGPARQRFSSHA